MNNHQPTQPPQPGMVFNVGTIGNKVMLQVLNTVYLEPNEARGLIATLQQAIDKADSAILIAGTIPPVSKIVH